METRVRAYARHALVGPPSMLGWRRMQAWMEPEASVDEGEGKEGGSEDL